MNGSLLSCKSCKSEQEQDLHDSQDFQEVWRLQTPTFSSSPVNRVNPIILLKIRKIKKQLFMNGSLFSCKSYNPAPASICRIRGLSSAGFTRPTGVRFFISVGVRCERAGSVFVSVCASAVSNRPYRCSVFILVGALCKRAGSVFFVSLSASAVVNRAYGCSVFSFW